MRIVKPLDNRRAVMTRKDTILLAIETTTSVCSVALFQGRIQLDEVTEVTNRRHNEMLPDKVRKVIDANGLRSADIDVVAVSIGPGSFTGLRVGLSFAKGFALGVGAAVVPVMTLDGLAHRIYVHINNRLGSGSDYRLCPLTVARRGEVFGRLYKHNKGDLLPESDPFLADAEELCRRFSERLIIGGEGADALRSELAERLGNSLLNISETIESFSESTNNVIFIPKMQASASSIGQIGMNIWQTDRQSLQPAGSLEPLYLKEFTVRRK